MERPATIYLTTPIKINNVTVNYSPEGVDYLIHHYKKVQKTEAHQNQNWTVREFLAQVISNLEYFKFLYDNQKQITL